MRKLKLLLTPQLPEDIGEVFLEWTFPEYAKSIRSRLWYLVGAAILGLLVLYAVLTVNYLFAVILVLAVLIILYQYFQEARRILVKIGEDGIILDNKFYPWKILKSFWFAYEPPTIKYLYIETNRQVQRYLPVPLEDINPLTIREILLNYLDEDLEKDDEELDDTLARILKIR
jgi:hypothetical protein